MHNARFMTAAHAMAMVAVAESGGDGPVTAPELAFSIGTNPVVVRRLAAQLRDAGLVEVARGAGGGVRLARPPDQITLADIAIATDTAAPGLARYAPGSPSSRCRVAPHIAAEVASHAAEAEAALLDRLATVTLESLAGQVKRRLELAT
jgi:DNA-binding IscR family transcriptional regulator